MALDGYLEVYQLRKDIMTNRAQLLRDPRAYGEIPTPLFQPIQQISLHGRLYKLFLIATSDNGIILVTTANFSKLHAKIR